MSTQTTFDLTGLTHAIQVHDCGYQLALYADDAEVAIHDVEQSAEPMQVLRGKSDIRRWLDGRSATASRHEIRDATASPGELSYTEECGYPDGSRVVLECAAQVHRGQISRAVVRIVHPAPRGAGAQTRPAGSTSGGGPGHHGPPTSAAPATLRHLPGQFLG